MARRDPEAVRTELFSVTSSFFVCGLLHQTGVGGGEDQSQGGDANGLRCGSPGSSGEAAYQRDSWCCFR